MRIGTCGRVVAGWGGAGYAVDVPEPRNGLGPDGRARVRARRLCRPPLPALPCSAHLRPTQPSPECVLRAARLVRLVRLVRLPWRRLIRKKELQHRRPPPAPYQQQQQQQQRAGWPAAGPASSALAPGRPTSHTGSSSNRGQWADPDPEPPWPRPVAVGQPGPDPTGWQPRQPSSRRADTQPPATALSAAPPSARQQQQQGSFGLPSNAGGGGSGGGAGGPGSSGGGTVRVSRVQTDGGSSGPGGGSSSGGSSNLLDEALMSDLARMNPVYRWAVRVYRRRRLMYGGRASRLTGHGWGGPHGSIACE